MKTDEERRRQLAAIHAKARNAATDSSAPSLEALAARQARRSQRARELDARHTSKSLIDARNPRAHLWMKDPGRHDLRGIDDKYDDAPRQQNPRRAEPGPARRRVPVPPTATSPSRDESMPPRPPRAPMRPPRPVPPTHAPKQVPTKPAPVETAPAKPARKRVQEVRDLMTSHFKPMPSSAAPPATPPAHRGVVDNRLRRLALGAKPSKPAGKYDLAGQRRYHGWRHDLSRGGVLIDDANALAVFDVEAKPWTKKQWAQRDQNTSGGRYLDIEGIVSKLPERRRVDLASYLRQLDGKHQSDVVPIGDSLYSRRYVEKIAAALPGDVEVRTGKDKTLYVRQGRYGVLLAPRISDSDNDAICVFLSASSPASS